MNFIDDFLFDYFEPITKSLYSTELNPLACQFGACILIDLAEKKIIPSAKFHFDGEPVELGLELHYLCDIIDDFFISWNGSLISREIDYIPCKPYQKYKKRNLEAFQELIDLNFITSVEKLSKENYEFEITEKLKKHQMIPYSIFSKGAA